MLIISKIYATIVVVTPLVFIHYYIFIFPFKLYSATKSQLSDYTVSLSNQGPAWYRTHFNMLQYNIECFIQVKKWQWVIDYISSYEYLCYLYGLNSEVCIYYHISCYDQGSYPTCFMCFKHKHYNKDLYISTGYNQTNTSTVQIAYIRLK